MVVRWISFSLLVLLLTACAGNEDTENTSSSLGPPAIYQEEQAPNSNPPDEEKDTVAGDISEEKNDAVPEEERERYYDAIYEDDADRPEPAKERVGKLEIDSIVTAEEIQPEQEETIMKYLTAVRDEDIDSIEELIHPESENPEFITSGLQNKLIQAVKELTIDHHRSTLLEKERGEGMATAVVAHLESADGSLGGTASLVLFKKGENWLIYRID